MKTVTTTREYDDQGRVVKETVVEHEQAAPKVACTCNLYGNGGYCPLHGYRSWYPNRITCGTTMALSDAKTMLHTALSS